MNLAEVWNTPGYFYAVGYALSTALTLWFVASPEERLKQGLSVALLTAFLIPFANWTKGVRGIPFALSMIVMVSAILLCTFVNLKEPLLSLFTGIKAFIGGEFASSLCWQLYYEQALKIPSLQSSPLREVVMLAAFAMILTAACFAERSLHTHGMELSLTRRDILIEGLIVLSVYVVSNLGYIDHSSMFSGSYARDVFAIRTLVDFSGVALIYAFQRQLIEVQIRLENEALQNIMRMQYQSYQLSQESIELINQKYHDLKHQIALLKARETSEKSGEYLRQMERDIKQYEAQHRTGHPVLDAILTSKSLYCQRQDIELKFIVDGKQLSFMEDMEIAALFGNMLDNAIESSERIANPQLRMIRLYVGSEKRFLRINIENYCEERVAFRNGLPITSKRDKRFHGFGMKSMQRTVEKYGGSMICSQRDNWFELKILIPNSIESDAQ